MTSMVVRMVVVKSVENWAVVGLCGYESGLQLESWLHLVHAPNRVPGLVHFQKIPKSKYVGIRFGSR
jgi:hypothetical protein